MADEEITERLADLRRRRADAVDVLAETLLDMFLQHKRAAREGRTWPPPKAPLPPRPRGPKPKPRPPRHAFRTARPPTFCAARTPRGSPDIHGALDRLFEDVAAFEQALGVTFAWVLHVGDFGVWPDPNRIDKATKKHDGAGDFPAWFAERRAAPRPTVFIKGNYEDFVWLDSQDGDEILPGLFYLRNGRTMDISEGRESIRVGGVGGCFGPLDFERQARSLQGYAKRHYTRDEIESLSERAGVDILCEGNGSLAVGRGRDAANQLGDQAGKLNNAGVLPLHVQPGWLLETSTTMAPLRGHVRGGWRGRSLLPRSPVIRRRFPSGGAIPISSPSSRRSAAAAIRCHHGEGEGRRRAHSRPGGFGGGASQAPRRDCTKPTTSAWMASSSAPVRNSATRLGPSPS